MPTAPAPPPAPALPAATAAGRRPAVLDVAVVTLVAFVLRAINLWQLRASPFFGYVGGDGRSYDEWAQRIAGGDWIGGEIFYQAPLYPYFLGVLYALLGHDTVMVRWVQALLGAAACGLLVIAGRRFFSRGTGLAAGLLLACYAPAIFFDALIQKSVLDGVLLCLVLAMLGGAQQAPRARGWLAIGAVLGALVLSRENAVIFVFAVLVWIAIRFRPAGRRRFAYAALVIAGVAALLLPVATRNRIVGGEFHLTTSQFGPNFYIGNNPDAQGDYEPLRPHRSNPQFERLDATELAEAAEGRTLSPAEVSSYWTGQAFDFIRSEPVAWLRLMVRKLALTWNGTELMDTEDIYTYAEWSLPLRVSQRLLHFGVLAPLALLGIWTTWPRRRELWLLYLMIGMYTASVVIFYVFARYRYPLVPPLALFAAAGITGIPALVRTAGVRGLVPAAAAMAACAVLCNLKVVGSDGSSAVSRYNIGTSLEFQGRHEEAIEELRKAVELNPEFAAAHFNLASVHALQGRHAEAIDAFRAAVRIDPAYAEAHFGLGRSAGALGDADAARGHYEDALRANPRYAEAHHNLGRALIEAGEIEAGVAHLEQAVQHGPELAAAHYTLGRLRQEEGDLRAARTHLERTVALAPEHAEARYHLGRVRSAQGNLDAAFADYERALELDDTLGEAHNSLGSLCFRRRDLPGARRHLERAVELLPDFADAHNNLGSVYASTNDLDGAIRHFERAVELAPDMEGARRNLERARSMRKP